MPWAAGTSTLATLLLCVSLQADGGRRPTTAIAERAVEADRERPGHLVVQRAAHPHEAIDVRVRDQRLRFNAREK